MAEREILMQARSVHAGDRTAAQEKLINVDILLQTLASYKSALCTITTEQFESADHERDTKRKRVAHLRASELTIRREVLFDKSLTRINSRNCFCRKEWKLTDLIIGMHTPTCQMIKKKYSSFSIMGHSLIVNLFFRLYAKHENFEMHPSQRKKKR